MKVLKDAEDITEEWVTATRLEHVMSKLPQEEWTDKRTHEVIQAMLEDVFREGKGEIVDSKEARRAVGKKIAKMYLKLSKEDVLII